MTGADLPNAFPYFIAIERLVSGEVDTTTGVAVLAGYTVIYCLPCLVLLLAGRVLHEHVQPWLQRLFRRLTGTSPRGVPWPSHFLCSASESPVSLPQRDAIGSPRCGRREATRSK